MRTIKFRGKASHNGEWLYGDLINIHCEYHILGEDDMREDGHHVTQDSDRPTWVEPDTIGQFTGLYDKYGKEIYEGDIIQHRGQKVIVEFYRGAYGYGRIVAGEHVFVPFIGSDNNKDALQFPDGTYFDTDFCEVIGNIHSDPKLLEQ